jgi:hypothetical protein
MAASFSGKSLHNGGFAGGLRVYHIRQIRTGTALTLLYQLECLLSNIFPARLKIWGLNKNKTDFKVYLKHGKH